MKLKTNFTTGACLAVLLLCTSWPAFAAPKKEASPSPGTSAAPSAVSSPAPKAPRAIPFHGTVSSVDQAANTFTITGKTNSRVFKVTDKSKVMKDGKPGTFADITANETVGGSYWKQEDGTLEVKTVKAGVPAASKKSQKTEAAASADASPAASASPSASPKKK